MMRPKRIITLILALIIIFVISHARKEAGRPVEEALKKAPVDASTKGDAVKHRVLSFNLEGLSDKGAKKWDVNGKAAEAVSENEIRLDSIVAKAYGEEAQATITADTGIYNKVKNNVLLEKNVKATIESTQEFTKDFVSVSGETASKTGGQDPARQKKTRTVITCDGEVLFDYERNQAYFNKNVKVVNDDVNIEADKITVNLDMTTKKIRDILAEGNVKIARGDNITYSDRAIYIDSEKKVVLTGQPKLVIYRDDALEGDLFKKAE